MKFYLETGSLVSFSFRFFYVFLLCLCICFSFVFFIFFYSFAFFFKKKKQNKQIAAQGTKTFTKDATILEVDVANNLLFLVEKGSVRFERKTDIAGWETTEQISAGGIYVFIYLFN